MPDQWGRVNHNDWNAMTGMINNIQAMGQRNQLFKQGQEDRAEQKEYKDSVNYNVAALNAGQTQARPYEVDGKYVAPDKLEQPKAALTGTPLSQVAAREVVAKDKQSRQAIRTAENADKYDKILNDLAGWRQSNPGMDWEKAPRELYAGAVGQKAYAELINQEAMTEQGQTQIMQNRVARAGAAYKQFDASRNFVKEAMQNGQIDTAVSALQKMSQELPLPYQLGDYDPGTKTFDVQYLDSNSGKYQSTGQMTLEEAAQKMNATGEKEFIQQAAMNFEAVRAGNLEKRMDPMYGKSTTGQRFLIIPQKKVMDPNQIDIEVRNEKTNEKIIFPSWEALQDAGITVENLGREKDLKDLDYKDQQIATSKAAMGSHQAAGGQDNIKAQKAQIDFYNKQFNTSLAPFKEGSGGIGFSIDESGQPVFEDGGAAFNKSQKFFHDHQADWQSLSPQEQTKFHGAATADSLYKTMISLGRQGQAMGGQQTDQQTEQTPYAGTQPPVQGARRAKDGNWYIQNNGKWEVVLEGGQQQPAPAEQETDAPPYEPGPHGNEQAAPTEQPQPIGEIEGKAVARTDKGYMILDGEQWRPPTPEEQGQIEMMARRGQLGQTTGWQYQTKYPGSGQKQWAINPGGQIPQLPNISGRR